MTVDDCYEWDRVAYWVAFDCYLGWEQEYGLRSFEGFQFLGANILKKPCVDNVMRRMFIF